MFILVLGREKSGKSRYAESLSAKLSRGAPVYIATMIPVGDGEAGAARIARHREQRGDLGFETVEMPYGLSGLELGPDRTALLEDVSNLLANYIFSGGLKPRAPRFLYHPTDTLLCPKPAAALAGVEAAVTDIMALAAKCENLIAVSLVGIAESDLYDDATNGYIAALREVNARLLRLADAAVEAKNGEPAVIKGNLG